MSYNENKARLAIYYSCAGGWRMYKVSNKEEGGFITTSPWLKLSGADRPNLRKKWITILIWP